MAGPATDRSRAAAPILAALFFAALTVLMTWPHALHLSDRMNDLWDAKQNAWILHWDFWQSFHDPANLFQAPILHPARYALAFSENLYGGAIFGFPLLALGAPVVAGYNAVFLFSMAFSAWAAWLLARYVMGDGLAALLAGLVYAFVPWRFAQLPHLNMQLGGFLCLLLYFLLRYLDGGRRRDLAGFGVCFAGNLLSTFHFGLFSGFLIATVLVCEGITGGREERRRMPWVLLGAAAATLACAPFLVPYTITSGLYGMKRTITEVDAFSAVARDFLSAGSLNRLYGAATKRWSRGEGDLFPGILAVVLAAGALLSFGQRGQRRRAVLFLCIGVVGLIVCFGSHTPVYRFLFLDVGSIFRAIRAPIRAIVLCHVALGVLAAWGLSLATRRLPRVARVAAVSAALALVGFEYRAFPLALYPYDPAVSALDRWLQSRSPSDTGALLEWPIGMPYDSDTMLRQAAHRKVLVNGHQSYYPPAYQKLVQDLRANPIAPPADIWEEIARFDAGTLIFHSGRAPAYERVAFRTFLREGLEQNRLRLWKSADDADGKAFVFKLGPGEAQASEGADPDSRRDLDALMAISDADYAPPTGMIHLPAENQTVAPGFWVHGWAVDDSGIARVEAATELGPAGDAQIGTPWPGLVNFFPTLPGADRGGWGFAVPPVPPGLHTLRVTLVGNDGGRT
ncbi:MAG TPA: glycosyltransferase family 39 protein, partial [Thermoanaerobaculia bacterium]